MDDIDYGADFRGNLKDSDVGSYKIDNEEKISRTII